MTPAEKSSITGLILAGGRSSRMNPDQAGKPRDKALIEFRGKRLVDHVFERIAPQVGGVMINANQNYEQYKSFGVRVVSDAIGEFAGPPKEEEYRRLFNRLEALPLPVVVGMHGTVIRCVERFAFELVGHRVGVVLDLL